MLIEFIVSTLFIVAGVAMLLFTKEIVHFVHEIFRKIILNLGYVDQKILQRINEISEKISNIFSTKHIFNINSQTNKQYITTHIVNNNYQNLSYGTIKKFEELLSLPIKLDLIINRLNILLHEEFIINSKLIGKNKKSRSLLQASAFNKNREALIGNNHHHKLSISAKIALLQQILQSINQDVMYNQHLARNINDTLGEVQEHIQNYCNTYAQQLKIISMKYFHTNSNQLDFGKNPIRSPILKTLFAKVAHNKFTNYQEFLAIYSALYILPNYQAKFLAVYQNAEESQIYAHLLMFFIRNPDAYYGDYSLIDTNKFNSTCVEENLKNAIDNAVYKNNYEVRNSALKNLNQLESSIFVYYEYFPELAKYAEYIRNQLQYNRGATNHLKYHGATNQLVRGTYAMSQALTLPNASADKTQDNTHVDQAQPTKTKTPKKNPKLTLAHKIKCRLNLKKSLKIARSPETAHSSTNDNNDLPIMASINSMPSNIHIENVNALPSNINHENNHSDISPVITSEQTTIINSENQRITEHPIIAEKQATATTAKTTNNSNVNPVIIKTPIIDKAATTSTTENAHQNTSKITNSKQPSRVKNTEKLLNALKKGLFNKKEKLRKNLGGKFIKKFNKSYGENDIFSVSEKSKIAIYAIEKIPLKHKIKNFFLNHTPYEKYEDDLQTNQNCLLHIINLIRGKFYDEPSIIQELLLLCEKRNLLIIANDNKDLPPSTSIEQAVHHDLPKSLRGEAANDQEAKEENSVLAL